MKTCLFFIIAVFIYVIINDVTVFGFVLSLNQSDSPRIPVLFFFPPSIFWKRFLTFSSCQPIFQLDWEEELSPAGQDGSLLYVRSLSTDLSSQPLVN